MRGRSLHAEMKRRQWARDPRLWARERAKSGGEAVELWSKQVEITESVRDNRRTAVKSCHGAGKSFDAAITAAWWMDIHKPGEAFIVTTADNFRQVKAVLWRYLARIHAESGLEGRLNQTEWKMPIQHDNGREHEELVGFGLKPDDNDPTAFQGIHSPAVLVIVDEANGVPKVLIEATYGLMSNDECRLLMLANPDDPESYFAECCAKDTYNVITISAFDTPNFTGEPLPLKVRKQLVDYAYVEDARRDWAPSWRWNEDRTRVLPPLGMTYEQALKDVDPFWASKVLGEFPLKGGKQVLIPMAWIEAAAQRSLEPSLPNELGVDVGGGGDESTTCQRRGPVARIISKDRNPNTMETYGKVRMERRELKASRVKIDSIGIGRGAADQAQLDKEPFVAVNVGMKARDNERFFNLRAEGYWTLRERFERGDIDIDPRDKALRTQLANIRFKRSGGRILVESKEDMMRRGMKSPNDADSLMLAYIDPPEPEKELTAEVVF